jgi:hypothetical protein
MPAWFPHPSGSRSKPWVALILAQAIFPASLPLEAGKLYFRNLAKPCVAKRISCDILT